MQLKQLQQGQEVVTDNCEGDGPDVVEVGQALHLLLLEVVFAADY
jgi:hypothetical protein